MPKKLRREEFIEKSKSKWGNDTFEYSKVEYKNNRTKVTLLCRKHNIEFEQQPLHHCRGHIGCPECIILKWGRHKDGYWTYNKCYDVAKGYEWLNDFIKNDFHCYSKSIKKGWLKDFTWLKRNYEQDENILTVRKHCIYGYFFPEFNSVYIGLTVDIEYREKKHRERGSLKEFCENNKVDFPVPKILEDNLSINDSKERECYWIDHYKGLGYTLINKARGGSLGSLGIIGNKYSEEEIMKTIDGLRNRTELKKKCRRLYRWLYRKKLMDKYFPNKMVNQYG